MAINETTTGGPSNTVAILAGSTLDAIMDDEDGADDLMVGNDSAAASILVKYYGKLMHHAVLNSFNISREYIESTLEPESDVGDRDDVSVASMVSILVVLGKALIIGFIILAAIFGNMLVIVSVMQHRRLR